MASLFARQLQYLGACKEAIKWVEKKEFEEAWASCEDIDWMFWLAKKLVADHKLFIQVSYRCARLVLHWVLEGEERPRRAVETTEAWLEGRASIEEVQVAASAAWDAALTAVHVAKDATWAAKAAARAAEAATWAAEAATWAAEAAARAAETAGDNSIKPQILNIIREVLTQPVREKLSKIKV